MPQLQRVVDYLARTMDGDHDRFHAYQICKTLEYSLDSPTPATRAAFADAHAWWLQHTRRAA